MRDVCRSLNAERYSLDVWRVFGDRSLNTGKGGATKREWGAAHEVLPLQKGGGGAEKVLAMLKWGHKRFYIVITQELEVLAIRKGGRKMFPPFKRRHVNLFSLS